MYIPKPFNVSNRDETLSLIRTYGFATVVSQKGGVPWASHLPLLLNESEGGDILLGHMAKNNEQWQHFENAAEILCIFHGPHSYISPSWYSTKIAVPTWNYATVHAYGAPQIERDASKVLKILEDTTSKYESGMVSPWKMAFSPDTVAGFLNAIVGFSVRITRLETKFKLGQNRSPEDQEGMLRGLRSSASVESQGLAEFIEQRRPQANQ